MIFIILLQALWGWSIPISKILLGFSSPIFLAGIRMTLAGMFLLVYKYMYTSERFQFSRNQLWLYAQIIFFGIYLKYILRYWGLSHLPAAKMSFMLNITPFCVALMSYIVFKEKLSSKQWLGLFIGFLGLIPILLTRSPAEQLIGEIAIFSWAELAIIAEILANSYGLIVARKLVRENGFSSGMTNGIRAFGGGFLALITSFFLEGIAPVDHVVPFIGWLFVLIILGNIICHNLYIYLLKYYSTTFISFTEFLSPLFVSFYGWLFLHETITWHYGASAFIVFVGLYLFYQDELSVTMSGDALDIRARIVQFVSYYKRLIKS